MFTIIKGTVPPRQVMKFEIIDFWNFISYIAERSIFYAYRNKIKEIAW